MRLQRRGKLSQVSQVSQMNFEFVVTHHVLRGHVAGVEHDGVRRVRHRHHEGVGAGDRGRHHQEDRVHAYAYGLWAGASLVIALVSNFLE